MSTTADVVEKLNTLIKLSAITVCGNKTQKEKILLLASSDISPKIIAELLGTTANTVSVTISRNARK